MFLIQDTSGRGYKATQSIETVRQNWDLDLTNDDDTTLGDWLEFADIGDTFEDTENRVTFTRIS